jgi:hypothetical protein
VAFPFEPVAASAGPGILFQHGNVQAMLGQVGRGGNATQSSADNEN